MYNKINEMDRKLDLILGKRLEKIEGKEHKKKEERKKKKRKKK